MTSEMIYGNHRKSYYIISNRILSLAIANPFKDSSGFLFLNAHRCTALWFYSAVKAQMLALQNGQIRTRCLPKAGGTSMAVLSW